MIEPAPDTFTAPRRRNDIRTSEVTLQLRHIGAALLTLGAVVGVVAAVALAIGFEPATLPAALLNVAAYKLTFLAAAGLLAAGAIVARYARRTADEPAAVARAADGRAAAGGARVVAELRPGSPSPVGMPERRPVVDERPPN